MKTIEQQSSIVLLSLKNEKDIIQEK